jgi:uncharacterized protein YjbJ (UPF0337 family)
MSGMQRDAREHQAGGKLSEAKGAVKEGFGKMVGNERMQAEGNIEKNSGKVGASAAADESVSFSSLINHSHRLSTSSATPSTRWRPTRAATTRPPATCITPKEP